jgi:hypothetical protein
VARAGLSMVRWRPWLAVRQRAAAQATERRGKHIRGWRGRVKHLGEEKARQKADRGGAGTDTKSSPEAKMVAGLPLGCARWGNEKERGGGGSGLARDQVEEEEGGGVRVAAQQRQPVGNDPGTLAMGG